MGGNSWSEVCGSGLGTAAGGGQAVGAVRGAGARSGLLS